MNRRVIFTPDDYWTHPPKENTMPDNHGPQYVNLTLPSDTITQTTDRVVLAMMAADDNPLGIAHYLILNTDFGCYRFQLTDDATASLLAQAVAHNEYGERLLREQQDEQ